jgi:hypothetical protein
MKSIHEPDPSSVNPSWLSGQLTTLKLPLKLERLLYVNRDYQGYIFVSNGNLPRSWNTLKMRGTAHSPLLESNGIQFHSVTGNFGLLRTYALSNTKTLVGYLGSSELSESIQAHDPFDWKWDQILAEQLRASH